MISLNRSKENKWILQKNISSSELMKAFVVAMNEQGNEIDAESIKNNLKVKNIYRGRSSQGSKNTMGVRMSQMCFYMFGYKSNNVFIPTPMTQLLFDKEVSISETSLINLFSMQFPSPYSNTPSNFCIYFGRLIAKLLLEKRINCKLYIDESIWFLPFIETINAESYDELVESILQYRKLAFQEKLKLFQRIENYNDVFANALHEMKYYMFSIFEGLGVLSAVEDDQHNSGKLFSFIHGTSTTRNDAYMSRKSHSGYITFNRNIVDKASLLVDRFSCFEKPKTQAEEMMTKTEWIRELYEFKPLEYIKVTSGDFERGKEVIEIIKDMVYKSKFGSRDGKEFELALKHTFELFREVKTAELISGAGDTDILCHVLNEDSDKPYKMNADAKTSGNSTSAINARRIQYHVDKNGSKYCIIVSPRFARGVKLDISNHKIVIITAESLANYCLKECLSSQDGYANLTIIDKFIECNSGIDITKFVDKLIELRHGISGK